MDNQSDSQAKVDNFKMYLKMVSKHIAGGVRPESYQEIAPTFSKLTNTISCSSSVEKNVLKKLEKCIDRVFEESDLTEKIKDLEKISQGSTTNPNDQLLESDPQIIRKHWLHYRREMLKTRLQETRQRSDIICDEIKKRRAIMEQQMDKMKKIQDTQFQRILLS